MFKRMLATVVVFAGIGTAAGETPAGRTPLADEQATPPTGYTYSPEGRRDPFVSLVGQGGNHKDVTTAGGIAGLLVDEVTVTGVIRGTAGYLAMIRSPGTKTYIVHSGDRLGDGSVKTITGYGVIFSRDAYDQMSLVKEREVTKRVRATGGR